jgi:CO dehydrogenase/acetyl-CoA synthase delta subunit
MRPFYTPSSRYPGVSKHPVSCAAGGFIFTAPQSGTPGWENMMSEKTENNSGCCGPGKTPSENEGFTEMLPIYRPAPEDEACCGPPPGPAASPFERPGYQLCPFVEGFKETPKGAVPRIKTRLDKSDLYGTINVRLGINRSQYKVAPGLYCIGDVTSTSPVLVTANYKLTFDKLRKDLVGVDAWILVLDTRGINVWCAAGKKTFSTGEVIQRVKQTHLYEIVSHRRLILPQLSATGVSGKQVKKGCGFKVTWGPVRTRDIKPFLMADLKADKAMRRVTFSFVERLILVPVELSFLRKYLIWILLAGFFLSGIGPGLFSFPLAWRRGLIMITACVAGIFTGAVAAPVLLPWIPGKAFAIKGLVTGLLMGAGMVLALGEAVNFMAAAGLILLITAISSYLAMNFTGSTPYTSPTGVEKEMRVAIPLQSVAIILSVGAWIGSVFI